MIGAVAFVTLCVIAILAFLRKRTKNAKQRNPEIFKVELSVQKESHRLSRPAELPGLENNKYDQLAELANTGIIELSEGSKGSELS